MHRTLRILQELAYWTLTLLAIFCGIPILLFSPLIEWYVRLGRKLKRFT